MSLRRFPFEVLGAAAKLQTKNCAQAKLAGVICMRIREKCRLPEMRAARLCFSSFFLLFPFLIFLAQSGPLPAIHPLFVFWGGWMDGCMYLAMDSEFYQLDRTAPRSSFERH